MSVDLVSARPSSAVIQNVRDTALPSLETASEVAFKLKVLTAERIDELAEAGYLPCWRIDGQRPLYRSSDVRRWVAENLVQVQAGFPMPTAVAVAVPDPLLVTQLPEELMPMADRLRPVPVIGSVPGIYFLIEGGRVVYVGQSIEPTVRVHTHRREKAFEQAVFVPVPRSELNRVEGAFIRLLRPALNGNAPIERRAGEDAATVFEFGLSVREGVAS